jgi:hypothetical protein
LLRLLFGGFGDRLLDRVAAILFDGLLLGPRLGLAWFAARGRPGARTAASNVAGLSRLTRPGRR